MEEQQEHNIFIGPFLIRNGFIKKENNIYSNDECTVTVLEDCYQIDFDHPEYGKNIATYTDSYSIMHLIGILTWNDLMDKNYKK